MSSPMKSTLIPRAEGQPQQSTAPGSEPFLPRGLSAANNTTTTKAADHGQSAVTTSAVPLPAAAKTTTTITPITTTATKTNANASSSSVYAHMLTNTTSTAGTYDKPPPFANSSYYGQTLSGSGGLGITTTGITANTSSTSMSATTARPMPIPTPVAPHGLPSTYRPVPVPQVSPYTAGSLGGASYSTLTHNNGLHSLSHTTAGHLGHSSSSSSSHHHSLLHHHSSNGHGRQSSSSTQVIGGGKNPFIASGGSASLATAQHQHTHHSRTAFRGSLHEIWRSLKESEREQIGQFEAWAEVEGMCRHCFEPGSSAADAPRKHHVNERWDAKRRVWVSRRSRSGLFGGRRRRRSGSSSDGTSSSASSSDSSSEGAGWSSATRKRKTIEHQIRHDRKIERRRRREERRSATQSGGLIIGAAAMVGRALGASSSSSGIKQTSSSSSTKTLHTSSLNAGLHTSGGAAGKASSVFYDPGYGADGNPHPHYYVEEEQAPRSRKSQDGVYQNVKHSKSSTTLIGSIWGGSGRQKEKGKSRWVYHSKNSSRSSVFSSPSSSSDNGLAYGSSVGSKSNSGGGFWGRKKKQKAASVASSDALAYGDLYSSSPDGPWGSFSPKKPAPISMAGSIKSSIWGSKRNERRSSWDAVVDKRQQQNNGSSSRVGGNSDAAVMAGSAALTRYNSTGGTRISATSKTGFAPTKRYSSTSGRLSRQPSNSSGWLGDSSVGSRRSSSSGSSLFEGGVAHDIKKKKEERATTVTSGRSWWTLGLGRSNTTTVTNTKAVAGGRRTKSPKSYSTDSSLTSSGDDARHSNKKLSRRASAVAALGGGLFGFSRFGGSSKKVKQQQVARGAGFSAEERNGRQSLSSYRENSYGVQDKGQKQITSRFASTTNISTSSATAPLAAEYLQYHRSRESVSEQTNSYQDPFQQQQQQPQLQQPYLPQWQQQPIRQIPHQRHEQYQQSGSATVITGATPSALVTRVGAPGEGVRPIPLPLQTREQKPVAVPIPPSSEKLANSVVNSSHHHHIHQHSSHTSSSSPFVSAPSVVQVQPAAILHSQAGLVSTAAGHVSEASSTSSSSDSSEVDGGFQYVARGTGSGVAMGVGLEAAREAVAGGLTKITKTDTRHSTEVSSPSGVVIGGGSSSGSGAVMGGGAAIGTGQSSQFSHAVVPNSSQSSQFLTGAPALAMGAFAQPARNFIDFDSQPPIPTGKMSLQEQVRMASLVAPPLSTGARFFAAANASRIAADQLRQQEEAIKARRDQELADQARQDTIRRKLEDDRRLDELARERIRQREAEKARIDELEKAAIRQAMVAREKREKEVAAAEKWRADHEEAERTRKTLEAVIVERRRRESVAVEEKVGFEQRVERENQEGTRGELLEAEARRLGYLREEKERLVQKQRRESITATTTELHSSQSHSSFEGVQRDVSRGRTFDRDHQQATNYTSASGEHATEEQLSLIEQVVASSKEKLESTAVASASEETEENRLSREALERQKAELEGLLAEAKKRRVKERRVRERSSDEYKKKERRRQRDSSRDREAERAEARRQEVEYVRKKLGLGPIVKDTPDEKKKAIRFLDEDKEAMIDRFGTWENWTGMVPRLIETPPTPRPGATRAVPVVHCEGNYYFGAATHETSSAPGTTYPNMAAPGTPSISITGPDDVPDLPSLSHEPETVSAEPEIIVAEPDFGEDDDFAPTNMPPFAPFNPPAGVESNHGGIFVPSMPSADVHGLEMSPAGVVAENASYYSGEVSQESEETARVAKYHRQVEETAETQRSQVEQMDVTGGSRQDYYAMAAQVDQPLEQIKSEKSKNEEKEGHERWSGGSVEGNYGSESFRTPGIPSVAATKPSIAPVMSAPQVHRVAEFQQGERVDVEGWRTSFGSFEEQSERKSFDSERERLPNVLKRTETASTKSETASLVEERHSLDSIAPDQQAPQAPRELKKELKKPSNWNFFRKEKSPAIGKGTLGFSTAARKLKDGASTSSAPEASSSAAQVITATPSSNSSTSRLHRPVSALQTPHSASSSSISSRGYHTAGSTTPTQTPRTPVPVNEFAESKPQSELDVFDEPEVVTPTPEQQKTAEFRAITAMAAEAAGYSEGVVKKVVNEEHNGTARRGNGTTATAFVSNFDEFEKDKKKRAARRVPESELEDEKYGQERRKAAFERSKYRQQDSQQTQVSVSPVSAFDARELLQRYDSQQQVLSSPASAGFQTGQLAGFGTDRVAKQTQHYEQELQSAARFEATQQLQHQDGQWAQFSTSPMLPAGFDQQQQPYQQRQELQRRTNEHSAPVAEVEAPQDSQSSRRFQVSQQHQREQRREQQHQDLQERRYSSEERNHQEEQRREDTTEGEQSYTGLGLRGGHLHRRDRDESEYEFAETKESKRKGKRHESGSAVRAVSQKRSSSSRRDVESGSSADVERIRQQQPHEAAPVRSYAHATQERASAQGAIHGHQYDAQRQDVYRETSGQYGQTTTERPPYIPQATEPHDTRAQYEQTTGTPAYVAMPSPTTGGYVSQPATPIEQWTSGGFLANVGAPPYGADLNGTKSEQFYSSKPAVQEAQLAEAEKVQHEQRHRGAEIEHPPASPAETIQKSYSSQAAIEVPASRQQPTAASRYTATADAARNAQYEHRQESETPAIIPVATTGGYMCQPATADVQWTLGGYLANTGFELHGAEAAQGQQNTVQSSQPAVAEWNQHMQHQVVETSTFVPVPAETTSRTRYGQTTGTPAYVPMPAPATGYISQPVTPIEQWTSGGYLADSGFELHGAQFAPAVPEWEARQTALQRPQLAQEKYEQQQSTEASAFAPVPVETTGGYIATTAEQWALGGYPVNAGAESEQWQENAQSIHVPVMSSQPVVAEWDARQMAQKEYEYRSETSTFVPAPVETTGGYIAKPATTTEQWAEGGYLANAGSNLLTTEEYERHHYATPVHAAPISSSRPAVAEWDARQSAQKVYEHQRQTTEAPVYVPMPAPSSGGYISQPATPAEEWTTGGYLANAGAELPYVPQPTQREYGRHQDTAPVQAERSYSSQPAVGEWNMSQSRDVLTGQSQHERREHTEMVPVRPRPLQSYSSQPAVAEWEARQLQYASRSQSQTRQYIPIIADETDQKTPRQYPADIRLPPPTAEMHTGPLTTPVEEYTTSEPGWDASISLSYSQPDSETSNAPSRRQRRASSPFSETTTAAESGTTYSVMSRGAPSTVPTSIDHSETFERRRESKREYDESTDSASDEEMTGEDVEGASLGEGQQMVQGDEGPTLGLRGGDAHHSRRRHRTKEEKAASKKRREARREEMRLREEQGEEKQQSCQKVSRSHPETAIGSTSKSTKEIPKQSSGDGGWSRFIGRFASPAPAAVTVAADMTGSLRRVQSVSEKPLKRSTSDMSFGDKGDKRIPLQRDSSIESWEEVQGNRESEEKAKKRRDRSLSASSDGEVVVSLPKTPDGARSASGTFTPLPADLDEHIAKLKTERTEEEEMILGLRGGDLKDEGKKKRMDILTYLEEKEKEQERKKKKALKEKERAERERKREKKERRKARKEEQKKAGETVAESSSEEQEGAKLDDNGALLPVEDVGESEPDEVSYPQAKQQSAKKKRTDIGSNGNGNNGVALPDVQIVTQPEEDEGSMAKKTMKIADEKKVKLSGATATTPSWLHEDVALVAGRKQVVENRSGRKEEKKTVVVGNLKGGDRLSDVEVEKKGGKVSRVLAFAPVTSTKSAGSRYVLPSSALPGVLPSVRFSLPGETQPVLPGQSPALQKPSEVVVPEAEPDILKSPVHEEIKLPHLRLEKIESPKESSPRPTQAPTTISDMAPISPIAEERQYLHPKLQQREYVQLPESGPASPYEPPKLHDSFPVLEAYESEIESTIVLSDADTEDLPLHLKLQCPEYMMLPDSRPGSPYELPGIPWWLPALPQSPLDSPTMLPQDEVDDIEELPLRLRLQQPEYVMLPDSAPGSPTQLSKLQDSVPKLLPLAIQDEEKEDVAGLIALEDAEELPLHLRLQRPEYAMLPDSTPGSPYELSEMWDLPPLPDSPICSPLQLLKMREAILEAPPLATPDEKEDEVARLIAQEDAEELPLHLRLQRPEYVMLPDSNPGSPYELQGLPWYLPSLPESAPDSPTQLPQPQDAFVVSLPLAKQLQDDDADFSQLGSPKSTNTEEEEEYLWWAASPERVECEERQYPLHLKLQQPEYVMLPDSNPGSPYELPGLPWYLPPLPQSPAGSPTQLPQLRESVPEKLNLEVQQPQDVKLLLSNPASPYEHTLPWNLPALPESPLSSPTQPPQMPTDSIPRSPIVAADGERGGVSLMYGGLWKKAVRLEKEQKTMRKVISNLSLRDILRPVDVPLPASRPGSPYELPALPWYLPPLPESPLGSPTQSPQSQITTPEHLSLEQQQAQAEASSTASSPQQAYYDYKEITRSTGSSDVPSDDEEELPLYLRLHQPDYVMLPDSNPGSPYELPALPWYIPPLPESPLDSPTLLPEDASLPKSDPSSPYMLPAVPQDLPALPPSRSDSPMLGLPDSAPSSSILPVEQARAVDVPTIASPVSDGGVGGVPLVYGGLWKKAFQQEKKQQTLRRVASVLKEPLRNHLRADDVPLPASRPGSPYELPALPWYLPPLPASLNGSPTLLAEDGWSSPSEPSSPYSLPADAPEMVELPESWPASPYSLPEVSADLPTLPDSPWYSPTLEPSPLDVDIPESRPESPYDLPMPAYLPMLPQSRASSPTLLPENVSLPSTRDGSPYMLPVVPNELPQLPESPWYSPTLEPSPLDADLPESRSTSPYQLPELPANLPQLPPSPWNSPTLGPGPQDIELPESECSSPYQPPAVPTDLPVLPASPWDSPTLLPAPQDLDLPYSRPNSPYVLPAVPDDLPQLPPSAFGSPTLLPQDVELPETAPGSPYSLQAVPADLPDLPPSPWDSPTLGPAPQDMDLPCSRSVSPYVLPAIPDDLPQLPESGWNSPTLGPSPAEVELPGSAPGSPYILPLVGDDHPPLPDSPWNSPTFGPRPTETDLPSSRPDSPYQLPPVPLELPALPKSPWHSPTLGPRPQEVSLPVSRPSSPYSLPVIPADLPQLPASPWDSPTLGPAPQQVSLPSSSPNSPYQLPTLENLPLLPASPWDSPTLGLRPQDMDLPFSKPGSPYQHSLPVDVPELPLSPWDSPVLGPRPMDVSLPISRPGSPYSLEVATDLELPESPWDSPTLGPCPQELDLPLSQPGSPYALPKTAHLPQLPSTWDSPALGPAPQDLELPTSNPSSPYFLLDAAEQGLPMLPSSPCLSPTLLPRPQEVELPFSHPGSPYQLSDIMPTWVPELPSSPWNSPTLGPAPTEKELPLSAPSSPYEFTVNAADLPPLPESPCPEPVEKKIVEEPLRELTEVAVPSPPPPSEASSVPRRTLWRRKSGVVKTQPEVTEEKEGDLEELRLVPSRAMSIKEEEVVPPSPTASIDEKRPPGPKRKGSFWNRVWKTTALTASAAPVEGGSGKSRPGTPTGKSSRPGTPTGKSSRPGTPTGGGVGILSAFTSPFAPAKSDSSPFDSPTRASSYACEREEVRTGVSLQHEDSGSEYSEYKKALEEEERRNSASRVVAIEEKDEVLELNIGEGIQKANRRRFDAQEENEEWALVDSATGSATEEFDQEATSVLLDQASEPETVSVYHIPPTAVSDEAKSVSYKKKPSPAIKPPHTEIAEEFIDRKQSQTPEISIAAPTLSAATAAPTAAPTSPIVRSTTPVSLPTLPEQFSPLLSSDEEASFLGVSLTEDDLSQEATSANQKPLSKLESGTSSPVISAATLEPPSLSDELLRLGTKGPLLLAPATSANAEISDHQSPWRPETSPEFPSKLGSSIPDLQTVEPSTPTIQEDLGKSHPQERRDSSTTTTGTGSAFTSSYSSGEEGSVLVSIEADPGYEVSVRRVSSGESRRRGSIGGVRISQLVGRFEELQPQSSTDSLRSFVSSRSVSPPPKPETKEVAPKKSHKSLFGGPSPEDDEAFNPFAAKEISEKFESRLARRHSDFELKSSTTTHSPIVSPTHVSFPLPTITEASAEHERPITNPIIRALQRTATENSFFQPPPPPSRAETFKQHDASTAGSRFITAEDILRLQSDVPRRAKSAIWATRPPELQEDGKMQVLKRGERAGKAPSLRRVGSQIESPRTSAEHIIFGERFTTPVRPGSAHDKTRDGILEAWGEQHPQPSSPTRPPSIRRRQSLKLMDLEQKVELLGIENGTLVHEKANLEKSLAKTRADQQEATAALTEKLESADKVLADKNAEIDELNKKLTWYQEEMARLQGHNASLTQLQAAYKLSHASISLRYDKKSQQLLELTNEHTELQSKYKGLQGEREHSQAIADEIQAKDAELQLLRSELQKARDEVRSLERKVMARQSNRYLDIKDPSHFAHSANILFQDVQKWSEDFSHFSLGRRCIHVHRVTDEEVKDRFENVMLDDRGVRRMLKDESRRGTAITAIMMRLIWEFVFTRYLFGLETEERQKLLSLERTLAEVGAPPAVHQWRATTLTLLSQRHSFRSLLTSATEATVNDIMRHLNFLLPPPPQHAATVISTLRALLNRAVKLALEMRTQRAEYVMLRPPFPEYDDLGEVSNTIYFNATRMKAVNSDASPLDLEAEHATIKMVHFPLIIRRGNEFGEEYEREHVVYQMQVFVTRAQLRSESRCSSMRSVASSVGSSVHGHSWRDDQATKQAVNRLTPITDHSPRTTPDHARRERDESPELLPRIPEQTIRLVDDSDGEMDVDDERFRDFDMPRYEGILGKKRRISRSGDRV